DLSLKMNFYKTEHTKSLKTPHMIEKVIPLHQRHETTVS
ncbi:uncharacterized protein METZ01_LOCUS501848, partial [marine metagenome]